MYIGVHTFFDITVYRKSPTETPASLHGGWLTEFSIQHWRYGVDIIFNFVIDRNNK